MERLTNPEQRIAGTAPDARETIIEIVTDNMLSAGLSLVGSRLPEEIADRYLEKQALDAYPIPDEFGGSCWSTISPSSTRRSARSTASGR